MKDGIKAIVQGLSAWNSDKYRELIQIFKVQLETSVKEILDRLHVILEEINKDIEKVKAQPDHIPNAVWPDALTFLAKTKIDMNEALNSGLISVTLAMKKSVWELIKSKRRTSDSIHEENLTTFLNNAYSTCTEVSTHLWLYGSYYKNEIETKLLKSNAHIPVRFHLPHYHMHKFPSIREFLQKLKAKVHGVITLPTHNDAVHVPKDTNPNTQDSSDPCDIFHGQDIGNVYITAWKCVASRLIKIIDEIKSNIDIVANEAERILEHSEDLLAEVKKVKQKADNFCEIEKKRVNDYAISISFANTSQEEFMQKTKEQKLKGFYNTINKVYKEFENSINDSAQNVFNALYLITFLL